MHDELERLAECGALEEMVRRGREGLVAAEPADALDLHHYLSWALFHLDDLGAALEHARAADDPMDEARALFHLWRFDEARLALDDCGDIGEAHWYRALVEEFTGGDGAIALRRAIALEPGQYRQPVRLSPTEVDHIVEFALRDLPPQVSWIAQEAVVQVRPLPEPHPDVDPLTLGLYVGTDIASRSHNDGVTLPPRIQIYQSNIERIARDRDHAADELRVTLLHDLGHHLGFGEDDMPRLGLE